MGQTEKTKTFVLASFVLLAIVGYALTNIWAYKLGQSSVNTAMTTTNVLGESQTIEPSVPPRFSTITKPSLPAKPTITACDPSGKCNSYGNPSAAGCPVTFTDTTCDNLCSDPSKRCRDY